eukprot:2910296-Lingulodinium_polyedra.AAC.1
MIGIAQIGKNPSMGRFAGARAVSAAVFPEAVQGPVVDVFYEDIAQMAKPTCARMCLQTRAGGRGPCR